MHFLKKQVTPNIILQNKVTNAVSSPGNMHQTLLSYNIRSPTFPSRACITEVNVMGKSCFYKQRPGGKIAFLPVKYKIPATHKSPDDAVQQKHFISIRRDDRNHSYVCYGFTLTTQVWAVKCHGVARYRTREYSQSSPAQVPWY